MNNKDKLHDEVESMIRQFELGAHVAVDTVKDGKLSYDAWSEEVTKNGAFSKTPKDNLRLIWIWDSIRKDPVLANVFPYLSPAGMQWNQDTDPLFVLERNSWLAIGLSRSNASALLSPRDKAPQDEIVSILLLDDLYMRPGRNDHLECSDCDCLLQLRPNEIYDRAREIDILGVDDKQIKMLGEGLIQIEVPSVNQAYTVASRRMERERRSHGGNIYDHVVYASDERRFRLEEIRVLVERGKWKRPSPPSEK